MKPVYVQFRGLALDVALELRSEPGAFVALGWLDDTQHNEMNEGMEDQWVHFHHATADAFCDLGTRTVWISAADIRWIREA